MPEKVILESEKVMNKEEVADFLEETASKIRKGKISLTQGKNQVGYDLPDRLELEVKVEEEEESGKSKKNSIELEIEWREGEEVKPVEVK